MGCVHAFLPQNFEHLRYDNTTIFLKASIDNVAFKRMHIMIPLLPTLLAVLIVEERFARIDQACPHCDLLIRTSFQVVMQHPWVAIFDG